LILFFLFMALPFFVIGEGDSDKDSKGSLLIDEERLEEEVVIHFFDDRLCPVCQKAKDYAKELDERYTQVSLELYSITETEKLHQLADERGVEDYDIMAPTIFIGDSFLQFASFSERHEKMMVDAIKGEAVEEDCCIIEVPFLNIEVDTSEWSLGLAAVVLGTVDGFNVCSIGALMLILSMVLMFDSKKKILFFGGLFIVTAVIVYGILVFAWGWLLNVLVKEMELLRAIIGVAALGGGAYFFREFLRFYRHGPTCKSSESALAQKATEKLKKSFQDPKKGMWYLALSVMSFAAIITLVELPCSIGIPLTFSGILAASEISLVSYILYIAIFLFFYMLIELVIFLGAVFTKDIWFVGSRVITWITFVGAMVLFYLAFYYLPFF